MSDKKPVETEVGKAQKERPKTKPAVPAEIEVSIKDHPGLPEHHVNDDAVQHRKKKTVFVPRGRNVPLGGKRLSRYLQK